MVRYAKSWIDCSVIRLLAAVAILGGLGHMVGCEVDSFFDPSKTGRFEFTPTTVPILERIDVVEPPAWHASASSITPEDLLPSDLIYKLAAGDVIRVEIFELYSQGEWFVSVRRIDASGNFRLPEVGDIRAAGLTAQQFEEELSRRLEAVINDPQVTVVVEEGGGFQYTVYGLVEYPGLYSLRRPDFRLRDAIAHAGYVPNAFIHKVYVIRSVPISEQVEPFSGEPMNLDPSQPRQPQPPDIQRLIEQLGDRPGSTDQDPKPGALAPRSLRSAELDELRPVRSQNQDETLVDIDEISDATQEEPPPPPVKPEQIAPDEPQAADTFIFDPERGEWIRVKSNGAPPSSTQPHATDPDRQRLIVDRVIEVDYERLKRGDSSFNIVIRPGDAIYVIEPEVGVVYVDGEVLRPGTYNLPVTGRLTLSRLFSAAGGGTPIAIPSRVDLIRMVGQNREAKIRVNLAAIRQGTEPDLFLKPDDHVIVGTNWLATPIAVIRNGFRATYGFGFLLDRNFGLDVFPPEDDLRGFSQ